MLETKNLAAKVLQFGFPKKQTQTEVGKPNMC